MPPAVVKKALLVGINQYAQPGANLKGCVNDALTMAKVLTEHYGFNREDIRLLTDHRATTANIRTRLAWLLDGARPGSVLVFHFSGHGSQVRDRDGDELEDGLDEILCPYDLNWDDPFTDDELRRAIQTVPDGANFTLLLDCCHSGTGTREFFKEPGGRGDGTASRYLVPPPDVAFRAARGVDFDVTSPQRVVNMRGTRPNLKLRRFGMSLVDQNAILIAGCRDDQTSADAWIENDYRGALSYSLYRALKTSRFSISCHDLVREAGDWLEVNGYTQVPQLECPDNRRGWSFLGHADHRPTVSVSVGEGALAGEMLPAARQGTRIVFIHGIGDHASGYSNRWRSALNRHLALPLGQYHEVVWDDVFDARSRGLHDLAAPPELNKTEENRARKIREELRVVFETRSDLLEDTVSANSTSRDGLLSDRASDRGFVNWLLNFDEYIGDFVKYLASASIRAAVDKRLASVLEPLVASGEPIVLVSHSWGTVVAYNTLRHLGQGGVALHATLGSPLWMHVVRRTLDFDGGRHGCQTWINADAKGDLIGGKLYGTYDVNHDYKVPSVGGQPHGSYFHPDNTLVLRDILARAITRIGPSRAAADIARVVASGAASRETVAAGED